MQNSRVQHLHNDLVAVLHVALILLVKKTSFSSGYKALDIEAGELSSNIVTGGQGRALVSLWDARLWQNDRIFLSY